MVFQFGYRGVKDGRPIISTGGLSALESAFMVLGWSDNHEIPECGNTCDVDGCMQESNVGTPWGDMYLRLCPDHFRLLIDKRERPKIKWYAVDRESKRDPVTGFLNE